jgi:hypothetical protein
MIYQKPIRIANAIDSHHYRSEFYQRETDGLQTRSHTIGNLSELVLSMRDYFHRQVCLPPYAMKLYTPCCKFDVHHVQMEESQIHHHTSHTPWSLESVLRVFEYGEL